MDLHDVKHLATLARLDIPEEEQESLLADLTSIVAYIDQVTAAPVSTGEDSLPEHRNVTRDDVPTNPANTEHTDMLLAQAVSQKDGFVKVQKIL